MKDSVTICIGTIGSSTFYKCKKHVDRIAKNSSVVKKIVVIKDVRPQSAWLNEMRLKSSDTKWCLQVDEDMYLKKNALNRLLSFASEVESRGKRILNCSSMLYDLFLEENVGSLKLWNTEPLSQLEFLDVLGGDRDYAKRAKALGYRNFSIPDVLGHHDSAPNPKVAFSKYYEYTQKIRKFNSDEAAQKFCRSLRRKWERDGRFISKNDYDGSKAGLSEPIRNKTKK